MTTSLNDDSMQPQRAKEWDELTDSEKIERMHGVVRDLRNKVNAIETNFFALSHHQHGPLGDVVGPITWDNGATGYSNSKWF